MSDAERVELERAVRDAAAAAPEKGILDADGLRAPPDGTMTLSVGRDAGKKLVLSIEVKLQNGEVWRAETPDPTPTGLTPSPAPPPSPLPILARRAIEMLLPVTRALEGRSTLPPEPIRQGRRERPSESVFARPPQDASVLGVGLRNYRDDFLGLLDIGLLETDAEHFAGLAQIAGWDAGAGNFMGFVQLGLHQAVSDDVSKIVPNERQFAGALQASLWATQARFFRGGLQVALSDNTAGRFAGIGQIAAFENSAGHFAGGVQIGTVNRAAGFVGLGQVGLFNASGPESGAPPWRSSVQDRFFGLFQVGISNLATSDLDVLFQLGLVSSVKNGDAAALVQAGLYAGVEDRGFRGLTQVGLWAQTRRFFQGAVQASLVAEAGWNGLWQIGAVNWVDTAHSFDGLAQIGAANFTSFHSGLQIGAYNESDRWVYGAQIGVGNRSEEVRGVQIGVVNSAEQLRGIQIGLVNRIGGIGRITPFVNANL